MNINPRPEHATPIVKALIVLAIITLLTAIFWQRISGSKRLAKEPTTTAISPVPVARVEKTNSVNQAETVTFTVKPRLSVSGTNK